MRKVLLILIVLGIVTACSKNPTDDPATTDCNGPAKSFAADVSPIVQSSCAGSGCHGAGSNSGPGELLNYTQISNARSTIRSAVISGQMPKNGTLTTAEKNSIICWIDAGAPNN